MTNTVRPSIRERFQGLAIGTAFGRTRIENRLHAADGSQKLFDRERRHIASQPAARLETARRNRRRGWWNSSLRAIAEHNPPERAVEHVVTIVRSGKEEVPLPQPSHPRFDHALAAIPHQAQIALDNFRFESFGAQLRFHSAEERGLP